VDRRRGLVVRAAFVVRRGRRLGRRQVAAAARDDLDARPLAARRDADGLRLLAARALRVARGSAAGRFESELRVEDRGGKTFVVREAFFGAPREDLLRNDSLRGRLAGTLAVDLLAWSRLAAGAAAG